MLGQYFDLLGDLITRYQATVGTFTGDGLMAFFNDPLPCDNPALQAITMAVEFRSAMEAMTRRWTAKGYELGFGIGITLGDASLGIIGFEGRRDYTAHGPMVNLSARLCGAAMSGQILIDQRVLGGVARPHRSRGGHGGRAEGIPRPGAGLQRGGDHLTAAKAAMAQRAAGPGPGGPIGA